MTDSTLEGLRDLLSAARALREQHDRAGVMAIIARLNEAGQAADFFGALAALDHVSAEAVPLAYGRRVHRAESLTVSVRSDGSLALDIEGVGVS